MKVTNILAYSLLLASASAFAPQPQHPSTRAFLTRSYMFSGAGGPGKEETPENTAEMKAKADQMGMPLDQYKLSIRARDWLTSQLDGARITTGDTSKVIIDRDANNPPKHFEITVTADGKALGASALSKELVSGLKTAAAAAKEKRNEAQKGMMAFIAEEMKTMGQA